MILIGAGGHAKLLAADPDVQAYYDPKPCDWISKPRVEEITYPCSMIMGFVGLSCESLERRLNQMIEFLSKGACFPRFIHPSAIVIDDVDKISFTGTQVLARAVINAAARVSAGAIVNTGAIVEHDAVIGEGTHVAPAAVVLGGSKVGRCCFIGANAVVVQGVTVPDRTFVKAGTVYTGKPRRYLYGTGPCDYGPPCDV